MTILQCPQQSRTSDFLRKWVTCFSLNDWQCSWLVVLYLQILDPGAIAAWDTWALLYLQSRIQSDSDSCSRRKVGCPWLLIRQHVDKTTEVNKHNFRKQSSMHLTSNGYINPSHPPDLMEWIMFVMWQWASNRSQIDNNAIELLWSTTTWFLQRTYYVLPLLHHQTMSELCYQHNNYIFMEQTWSGNEKLCQEKIRWSIRFLHTKHIYTYFYLTLTMKTLIKYEILFTLHPDLRLAIGSEYRPTLLSGCQRACFP